jgi:hypothetical protein
MNEILTDAVVLAIILVVAMLLLCGYRLHQIARGQW